MLAAGLVTMFINGATVYELAHVQADALIVAIAPLLNTLGLVGLFVLQARAKREATKERVKIVEKVQAVHEDVTAGASASASAAVAAQAAATAARVRVEDTDRLATARFDEARGRSGGPHDIPSGDA